MNKSLYLIFDLDGCLIDSSEVQKAAFFGSYKEVVGDDHCPSYEEYIKHTGDSVNGMLKKMGLPAAMAASFRRISSESVDKILVNWEAMKLVRKLKKYGYKTALCTGKDHYRTVEILKYFQCDNLFDVLICGDDVPEPKPSAMPILKAMEALGADPENTVMIGDGYNDIKSAKNAGVKSILTLWYGDAGVPKVADYYSETVEEMWATIDKISSFTANT